MTWLLGMKNAFIALLIGLALGGLVGYLKGDAHRQAETLKAVVAALQQQRVDDAEAVRISSRANAQLTTKLAAVAASTDTSRKEVKRYVPTQPAGAASSPDLPDVGATPAEAGVQLLHASDLLLSGAVCVLQRARDGQAPDRAACESNGAGRTPSGITAADLIDNDLQVVGKYHELAKKHDELVDYVEDLQRKYNGAPPTEKPNDH